MRAAKRPPCSAESYRVRTRVDGERRDRSGKLEAKPGLKRVHFHCRARADLLEAFKDRADELMVTHTVLLELVLRGRRLAEITREDCVCSLDDAR